jgi:hypothetical protein
MEKKYLYLYRQLVGFLGGLLPIIVIPLSAGAWRHSISATYWTAALPFFVGILFSAGILLICYSVFSYKWYDTVINSVGGVAMMMVACFPCESAQAAQFIWNGQIPIDTSSIIHSISALVLFASLVFNVLFCFSQTSIKWRKVVYYACAGFMLLGLPFVKISIWIPELFLLVGFSVAWLTKGWKHE